MNGYSWSNQLGNLRNINKHAILDLIRFTPGGISRAELARQVGLSRAAVTSIINDLLGAGVVRESDRVASPSGRRATTLEINPMGGTVLGVDMGATHVTLLLADLAARVLQEEEMNFDVSLGPQACLEQVDADVRRFVAGVGLDLKDILTVGVGVPGPVFGDRGMVTAPPIMPGWDNYPIRLHLESLWGCPVTVNNDAELGALGEWAYGAGRSEGNLVYIKVGSGIGAGIIINNVIYRGAHGTAGEIGHITIQENGPQCTCGNRGCLEALAGGRAISRLAQQAVHQGQRTQLSSITPLEKITARDVIAAARRGDLVSQQIVTDAGHHLGTAIASLINLLNPGIVVVGGGVAQTGDLLLEPLRQVARERSLKAAGQSVRITASMLGKRSSGMGAIVQASTLVLHKSTEAPEAALLATPSSVEFAG